jgi:hypothetical protein
LWFFAPLREKTHFTQRRKEISRKARKGLESLLKTSPSVFMRDLGGFVLLTLTQTVLTRWRAYGAIFYFLLKLQGFGINFQKKLAVFFYFNAFKYWKSTS